MSPWVGHVCPGICLNIIQSVSMRVILDEINICVSSSSKQIALSNMDGHQPTVEQKDE